MRRLKRHGGGFFWSTANKSVRFFFFFFGLGRRGTGLQWDHFPNPRVTLPFGTIIYFPLSQSIPLKSKSECMYHRMNQDLQVSIFFSSLLSL